MTGPVELSREDAQVLLSLASGASDDLFRRVPDDTLVKLRALASGDPPPSLPASSEWRWRGMPGHLIVSASCCFHMVTEAHGFRVSTIDRVERGEKR